MNIASIGVCETLAGMTASYAMVNNEIGSVSKTSITNAYKIIKQLGISGLGLQALDIDDENILAALAFFREMPETQSDDNFKEMSRAYIPDDIDSVKTKLCSSQQFRFGFIEGLRRQLQDDYDKKRKSKRYQGDERIQNVDKWFREVLNNA